MGRRRCVAQRIISLLLFKHAIRYQYTQKLRLVLAIKYHPNQRSLVIVNFDGGFKSPEMVKRRLAIVLSPAIKNRIGLCTIVPLSTTPPQKLMPYHSEHITPFELPQEWGNIRRWIKGDMVCAVSLQRVDLLRLGKDISGKRIYQTSQISVEEFEKIQKCVLHGLGLSHLTKQI